MPTIKPDAAVIDGKLAVFIGTDYKLLPLEVADPYVRKLQGLVAQMRRAEKREKRKGRAA